MKLSLIKGLANRVKSRLMKDPDKYLQDVTGVIHVGANTGQERELYNKFGLRVLWIEPIPEIFETLKDNLRDFPNQRAIQCLVTDHDEDIHQFHIANNNGMSSSILDLKHHRDVWPSVNYTNTMLLKSITLTSLFERECIDASKYQALILDTQGAELLVLNGCIPLLHGFKYIKTEVADFESYESGCQLLEINSFMIQQGYIEFSRHKFASRPEGGNYFDIIYKRKTS